MRPAPRFCRRRGAPALLHALTEVGRDRLLLTIAAIAAIAAAIALTAPAGAAAAAAAAEPPLIPPTLSVRSAILIEESTGQQLYGASPDEEVPIASTTKLMTALITLEHVRHLNHIFVAPDYYAAPADSQIGLRPGDRMTVHDLLLALMLPSADDAAEDLAYNVGHGSVARFIGMMNARARQLGLTHTHYSTPIGLDTAGNYSTASDLVKLATYELEHNRFFSHIVSLPSATLATGPARYVVNRNDLVGRYPWINGVKTGHTDGAGYVLVASAKRDGMTLLSAVLGTSSEAARDANTLALLDYGFANFRLKTPVHRGEVLARPAIKGHPGVHAQVIAASSFTRVIENRAAVSLHVVAPRQLVGPLRRHATVGYVLVHAGTRNIARVPLLLAHRVPAPPAPTLAARIIKRPITLLVVLVLIGLAAGLIVRRIVRRRGQARAMASR